VAEGGFICVEVAGSVYGLPVAEVQEVIGHRAPTRLFHAPAALAGITSLRGEVLPIIDVASLLGAAGPATGAAPDARVVVVREAGGARRRAGLKVDALLGMRSALAAATVAVPPSVAARLGALAVAVVSEPTPAFTVLSVTGILDAPALGELGEAALE
jgi:purine-binding chemotaxis protein CheW